MANQVRRVAILTLALLATVGLVRMAMSGFRNKSPMTAERTYRRLEMVGSKDYHEIKNHGAVTYTYLHERAAHKVSGYRRLGTVDETKIENGGSRVLSRENKFGRKLLYPERGTPGGPDSQHHPPLKKISVNRNGQ